jgi:hypothetical protein
MGIVGFSFTKMLAEKHAPVKGKVTINNNVTVTTIEDAAVSIAQGKRGLRVKFIFESKFEPAIGQLHFEGEVILLEEVKVAEDVLQHWAKEHALPKEMFGGVLNHILDHSNIEALIMAREINLPSPIPLPKASFQLPPKAAVAPKSEKKADERPKEAKQKTEKK